MRKRDLGILNLECFDANGLTVIHMGTGSGGPGWAKGGDRAACVISDLAGRMTSPKSALIREVILKSFGIYG